MPWVSPKDMKVFRITDTQDHITEAAVISSACSVIPVGSVLMVVRSGILQHTIPVAITDVPVCLNQDMKALIPDEQVLPEFLAYVVQGLQQFLLDEWVKEGATVESIEHDRMADTPISLPCKDLQFTIASYLDVETARIDALIGEKSRLISALSELRKNVVTEAVTQGIDLSDSCVRGALTWIDKVPAGWKIAPLKRYVRLTGGHTPSTANPEYWDGPVPWFSPKDMKADELVDSIDHVTELAVAESGLQVVEPMTTMIVVRGMILAHTFPVCVTRVPATLNQDMKALIPDETIDRTYLPWLLRGVAPLFLSLTDQSGHGTMVLRTDRFMSEPLPIPPVEEQLRIVAHLESQRARISKLLAHVLIEVDLLKEMRAATITDAVLGRIDVRVPVQNKKELAAA